MYDCIPDLVYVGIGFWEGEGLLGGRGRRGNERRTLLAALGRRGGIRVAGRTFLRDAFRSGQNLLGQLLVCEDGL